MCSSLYVHFSSTNPSSPGSQIYLVNYKPYHLFICMFVEEWTLFLSLSSLIVKLKATYIFFLHVKTVWPVLDWWSRPKKRSLLSKKPGRKNTRNFLTLCSIVNFSSDSCSSFQPVQKLYSHLFCKKIGSSSKSPSK